MSFGVDGQCVLMDLQTLQAIFGALDYTPNPTIKDIHIKLRNQLAISSKLHSQYLTFIVLEGTMNATEVEKES